MELNKGEFILYNHSLGKHQLAKVLAVGNKRLKVRNENTKNDGTVEPGIEISRDEVVANLGTSPRIGSAYGVKIEPLRRKDEDDYWGEVNLFVDYDDKQYKQLLRTFALAAKIIGGKNLPPPATEIHVRQQSGKYDGMYKFRPKLETDVMTIRPRIDFDQMDYIICHEYMHGIWFRHMTQKQHMRWIRMYNESVILQKPTEKELRRMMDDLVSNGDVGSFYKELDEEQRKVFKVVLRHIKQVHSIERHHLSLMLALNEDLGPLWPTSVELGDKNIILTEYATKNPEELFAETGAYFLTGRKTPKRLQLLLDETLGRLKK